MVLRLSRNRLYQVAAFVAVPVAVYNYLVWFGNPEHKWEQQYLKSLIGAISLTILSVVLTVLSCVKQDKIIVLCNRE